MATGAPGAPAAEAAPAASTASEAPASSAAPASITATIEKAEVAYANNPQLLAMASIAAPKAVATGDSEQQRPPLDLIAVVDRSGSMSGPKIELMRRTLESLVTRAGLKGSDRFGLVTFDHAVAEEIPLQSMDQTGRTRAQGVISNLRPGGATNLSGGLLKSVEMLGRAPATEEARTRAIMLFTDGLANNGIIHTAPLIEALTGAFTTSATTGLCYTFGFGEQHNENMLKAVAEASQGQYYFITGVDDIPEAFADCLGGLVSVVAQNATLRIDAPLDASSSSHGCTVSKVLGHYKTTSANPWTFTIELGDLYAEDSKDILLEVRLPALTSEAASTPVLCATLRYFSVPMMRFEEVSTVLEVGRPRETPVTQPINLRLDEQRNRIRMAEGLERATAFADSGDLRAGRATLEQCKVEIRSSPSAQNALCSGLLQELEGLAVQYEDTTRYRSLGAKMSKMQAMSHHQQRGNHASANVYAAGSSSKAAMKRAWMSL